MVDRNKIPGRYFSVRIIFSSIQSILFSVMTPLNTIHHSAGHLSVQVAQSRIRARLYNVLTFRHLLHDTEYQGEKDEIRYCYCATISAGYCHSC